MYTMQSALHNALQSLALRLAEIIAEGPDACVSTCRAFTGKEYSAEQATAWVQSWLNAIEKP